MALEQPASLKATAIDPEPVIENEIPTYRAISPVAIVSAGLGLISGLAFTDPMWLVAAVLAVITGALAEWKIRRMSDVLTGRSFAQAGIALGLIFGVSSLSYTLWANRIVRNDARKFGIELAKTLNAGKASVPVDTADIVWYMIPPPARKGITPEDARSKIAMITKESEKFADLDNKVKRSFKVAGPDEITLDEVEDAFFQELDTYATLRFKVGTGVNHDHEHVHKPGEPEIEGLDYLLVRAKGMKEGKRYKWFVDYIVYPYIPQSYKHVEVKKADDGHGHAH